MSKIKISETILPLAVEDRFLIFGIREAEKLCPDDNEASDIGNALFQLTNPLQRYIPIFDLRGLNNLYNDVQIFIESMSDCIPGNVIPHVLVNSKNEYIVDQIRRSLPRQEFLVVRGNPHKTYPFLLDDFHGKSGFYKTSETPLEEAASHLSMYLDNEVYDYSKFDYKNEDNSSLDFLILPRIIKAEELKKTLKSEIIEDTLRRVSYKGITSKEVSKQFRFLLGELPSYIEKINNDNKKLLFSNEENQLFFPEDPHKESVYDYLRVAFANAFLAKIHSHSLLVEFAMIPTGEQLSCIPYHAHAIHRIEAPINNELIIGRPAIVANRTSSIFTDDIAQFQRLLNKENLKEKELQLFFEEHPNFLKGLNYKNIYPHIVLERDDCSRLIPDFILEPTEGDWCDILEIKLPIEKIVVDRKDRSSLAAGIHKVAAQLREYAAYFEQEKYRKYVYQKYGLKIYCPKLIALIGRDMHQMDNAEIRRTITAYSDFEVLTFDKLIRHAQSHILI